MKKIIYILLTSIIYLLLINSFAAKYIADVNIKNSKEELAKSSSDINSFKNSLKNANLAIKNNPLEPEYYRQRAKAYIILGEKERALNDLETALFLSPNNLAIIRDSIPLYFFLASKDLKKPVSQENIDQDFISNATNHFKLSKAKYPNDVGVLVTLAKYEKRLGLENDYNESINKISELRPDLLEWHPDLVK